MTAPDAHNRSTPLGAPTTAREADALESWLESITTPCHVRRGDPAWSPAPSPSPNGSVNADRSLKESAAHAHAMIASAERETGPDVPVDAIWEKIMASTTPHPTTSGTAANQRHPERSRGISRRGDDSRARPISAWLSGSHWAVSTLMLAAVVVGIVALYNSFAGTPGSPGNDPAINPGIAMASPDETQTSTASSSPSADAAWLQPISPDECDVEPRALEEVGALVQDPGQVPPREYLPATGVEPSLAQKVADAQRAWEACHASGLLGERRALESLRYIAEIWPHDVLSYTNSETFDEWVALNEVMRAAFLDPDIESYLVESEALPAYDCETGYPAPDETDLSSQMAYQVIQPHHLVQLPDGRIGGPVSSLVGPGFVHCLSENPPAVGGGREGTTVHIFAEDPTRGGRWALDEQFGLCVSGCDAYYEEIASLDFVWPATPVATPAAATPAAMPSTDAAWLQPYTPDECDVEPRTLDEAAALMQDPGETVPRQYGPVERVSDAQALEIASANRVFQSCSLTGETGEWRAMVSPRLIFEGGGSPQFDTIAHRSETYENYVANHRELSEMLLTDPTKDYTVESARA